MNTANFYKYVENNDNKFKHISVVTTVKGAVLGIGTNVKTNPINKRYGYRCDRIHAEIAAILSVDKSVFYNNTAIHLYSLRFGKTGNLLMAKPCNVCSGILERYTNLTVFYSDSTGQVVKL